LPTCYNDDNTPILLCSDRSIQQLYPDMQYNYTWYVFNVHLLSLIPSYQLIFMIFWCTQPEISS